MIEQIKAEYLSNPSRTTILEIGHKHGLDYKEVIAMLGSVYIPAKYINSSKEIGATKRDLVMALARSLDCNYLTISSLEKANKEDLKLLLKKFDPKGYEDLTTP